MKRIFDDIYSKTLKRKKELNRFNYYNHITIPNEAIQRDAYLNFSKALKLPLIGQSSFYIYDNIFSNDMINKRFPVNPKQVYTFIQFAALTRTMIQVMTNGVLIDPALCSIYVTGHNTSVIIVNGNVTNVTVTVLKGVSSYTRFNTNTTMVIPSDMLNSFMVFNNGVIDYLQPVLSNGIYRITINGAGRWITVVLSPNILVYRLTPISNGTYNYISFPIGSGFVDLPNVHLFKQSQTGFSLPTDHTPMYDGVIVPDTDQRIVVMYNRGIPKYEDLIHQYNKYRDYMVQYLNNTLPTYIKDHEPFVPVITDSTTYAQFREQMAEALQDFPNFYREYLESIDAFQFTTYTLSIPAYTITMRINPKNVLFFNDGLNIAPQQVTRSNAGVYTLKFKQADITGTTIHVLNTGRIVEPYVQSTKALTDEVVVGPHLQLNQDTNVRVFESSLDLKLDTLPSIPRCMAMDKSGELLYVGCTNGIVYKINSFTMEILGTSQPYGGVIQTIAIGNNGKIFIGGATVYKIFQLNPDTLAKEAESVSFNGTIFSLTIGSDSNIILTGGNTLGNVRRINSSTLVEINQSGYLGDVTGITTDSSGSIYVAIASPAVIRKLHPTTLAQVAQVSLTLGLPCMVVGNDNKLYVSGSGVQVVHKLNTTTLATETSSINLGGAIISLIKANDGSIIALTGVNTIIKLIPTILSIDTRLSHQAEYVFTSDGYLFTSGNNGNLGISKFYTRSMTTCKKRKFEELTGFSYESDVTSGTVLLDPTDVGKNIHVVSGNYNYAINKPYSGLAIIELPLWSSFVDRSSMMVFLKGRLLKPDHVHYFNPFEFTFMKGKAAVVFDIDTDIVEGETISAYLSSNLEMAQYTQIVTAGTKLIEMVDKTIPFSTKYNLVFVNGRLIHPSDIQVIDNYRFSVQADSIHEIYIFRKKFDFEYSDELKDIKDKWAIFIESMTESQLESLLGITLFQANDTEAKFEREVYYEKRHLFEVFYAYCLYNRRIMAIEDHVAVREQLSDILLPDGRVPISTYRTGQPRYKL